MKFAKAVFWIAGIEGVLVLLPLFFLLDTFGRMYPPAINHAELYYSFLCVTMAWQVAFLMIGSDPARFRPLMVPAMLEKFLYVGMLFVFGIQGRINSVQFASAIPDFCLGLLFVAAFLKMPAAAPGRA